MERKRCNEEKRLSICQKTYCSDGIQILYRQTRCLSRMLKGRRTKLPISLTTPSYAVSQHMGGGPRAKQYAVSRLMFENLAGPTIIFDPMT